MLFSSLSPSAHQRACAWKQQERQSLLSTLSPTYTQPLTSSDHKVHTLSLAQIVAQCRAGTLAPSEVLMAYGKKALAAHSQTNCLTDVMFEEALATPVVAGWAPGVDAAADRDVSSSSSLSLNPGVEVPRDRDRLLLGVPVSIKDTVDIKGHDTTIGYSRNVGHPVSSSSPIVKLLQDAGALVHAKTSVPTGLFHLETESDVYGLTTNPHNSLFTVGGSSGGGAALLACGGTKIEIASDIGGSARIPAHFCGVWSLKGSQGRFPAWRNASSLPGLEGIPLIAAPMASSLDDLEEFWRRVVLAEPWQYDHTCIPLPWRPVDLQQEGRKLKWGVMWDDGTVPSSPACRRALATVANALRKQGHEVVDFIPPDVGAGLQTGYQILFADGAQQIANQLQPSEKISPPAQTLLSLFNLPRLLKRFLAFLKRTSDPFTAQLYSSMHPRTVLEDREAITRRDEFRALWHKRWLEEGLDFVVSTPHPIPAFEHGKGGEVGLLSVGVTFLFNLLDYTAGVIPVTRVDKELDALPPNFFAPSSSSSNYTYHIPTAAAQGVYLAYDPEKMHGLPLGVQVVGRRLEEEKVLQGMRVVRGALAECGVGYGEVGV